MHSCLQPKWSDVGLLTLDVQGRAHKNTTELGSFLGVKPHFVIYILICK